MLAGSRSAVGLSHGILGPVSNLMAVTLPEVVHRMTAGGLSSKYLWLWVLLIGEN